ncbi:MAG: UPF0182 family protein [Gemmatimonadota bacterium]|nr:UPF0182 family protein [Gemmatimonadota bacterium]
MTTLRNLLGTLKGGRLAIALLILAGLVLIFGRVLAAAYVEVLWQQSAGFSSVFWRRVLWSWGTRLVAGLAVAGVVFLNLKIAAVSLGGIQIRRKFGNIEISEQLPSVYVSAASLGAAGLLGLWFGAAVPSNLGLQIAAMLGAGSWGMADPVLGRDLSFYVFQLPVWASAVTFALVVTFLVFTLASAAYATTGALRWVRGRVDIQDLARRHLGVLVAVFLLLVALRVWLGRSLLLWDGNSAVQGIVGYADVQALLPAQQTLVVICLAAAVGVLWGTWKNRILPAAVSLLSVVLGGLLITQVYPGIVQRFQVEPNELARETPYIEHNLRFTRMGFGLHEMGRRSFGYAPESPVRVDRAMEGFTGLPVWNSNALLQTYRSLEARFPYYDFPELTIDRYQGEEGREVMAVSVREIDPSGIQDPNWQNLHLRDLFIRGMGAVVSRAASRSQQGRPEMLISGLPPERTAGAERFPDLQMNRPEVYFGSTPQLYALLDPTGGEEAPGPLGARVPGVDFPEGIQLGSRIRTAVLAWRFQDANLFFASDLPPETRLVYRRQVRERAQAIAPFLRFPEAPYPVLADGRIVWVLEGFTGTRAFPLSSVHDFGVFGSPVNYVRNSVKVTVDAVTGAIRFHRVPVEDPLIEAYAEVFPELFEPVDEMPDALRRHIRYPRSLLNLQANVLLQYHQETAADFHGQQDVWVAAQEQSESTTPVRYGPEYGLYTFPGDSVPRFNLTTVFVPTGRPNLTGMLAGRTNENGVPELDLLDVPVADQVPGPRQIEALVEQDPGISQQFSLWRSGGSQVWTGHLHLLPVNGRMLYMEPVFLAAESEAIPELRRFLVSDGVDIVMTEQLDEALALLTGEETQALELEGAMPVETMLPETGETETWPDEALSLLERAEDRLRAGDWEGFGTTWEELRTFLRDLRDDAP